MKVMMGVLTFLCISLSLPLLITPCASFDVHHDPIMKPSPGKENGKVQIPTPSTVLPRKLKVTHEVAPTVKEHAGRDHQETMTTIDSKQKMKNFPEGNPQKKESTATRNMGGEKGTSQEWVEVTDLTKYFTMDYGRVRRRRPIHNKSLPTP